MVSIYADTLLCLVAFTCLRELRRGERKFYTEKTVDPFRFFNLHKTQDAAESLRGHEMYVQFIDHMTYHLSLFFFL